MEEQIWIHVVLSLEKQSEKYQRKKEKCKVLPSGTMKRRTEDGGGQAGKATGRRGHEYHPGLISIRSSVTLL